MNFLVPQYRWYVGGLEGPRYCIRGTFYQQSFAFGMCACWPILDGECCFLVAFQVDICDSFQIFFWIVFYKFAEWLFSSRLCFFRKPRLGHVWLLSWVDPLMVLLLMVIASILCPPQWRWFYVIGIFSCLRMLNLDLAPSSQQLLVPGLDARSMGNRQKVGQIFFSNSWHKGVSTVWCQASPS